MRQMAYKTFDRLAAWISRSPIAPLIGNYGSPLSDAADRLVRRVLYPDLPSSRVINGVKLQFPKDGYFGVTLESGEYEPQTTSVLRDLLDDATNFVDVGAHVGYYTLTAAAHLKAGHVYAFEPDPELYRLLERNVEQNEAAGLVTTINAAVTDRIGKAQLFCGRRDRLTNSIFRGEGVISKSYECRTTTLDAFFEAEGWPRIDLVKIDVEGAEQHVLRGMAALSKKNPALKIIIEFCPSNLDAAGVTPKQFFEALSSIGFRNVSLIHQSCEPLSLPDELSELVNRARPFVNLLCER